MTQGERDRACLERVRRGDSHALEELYDRYNDFLYSLVRRIVSAAAEAEDVMQEAWLSAWRRASTYDPARGSVAAWLVTIARSRAIDRVRSEGARQRAGLASELDPPEPAEDPSRAVMDAQRRERVTAALAGLEPQHRQVLELGYFSGLTQSEIANKIGAPLGTVKSWTRQALLRLSESVSREDWS